MVTLTPEIKQQLNIESDGRIQVAAERGINCSLFLVLQRMRQDHRHDVIQTINNQPVTTTEEVQQLVNGTMGSHQLRVQRNQG